MSPVRTRVARLLAPSGGYDDVVTAAPAQTLRAVVRRFWPAAKPFRRWIPVLLFLVALGALVEAAEIWLFQYVVDDVLVAGDLGALIPLAIGYLALTLGGGLVSFADDYLGTSIAERLVLALRLQVLDHVQRLSLDVLNRHRLGDLVTRVSSDVQQIETLLLSGITEALSAVLRIAFFATALFILEWRLALVVLVIAPAFWLVARHFSRLVKRASREQRRRVGSLGAIAEEAFSNAALVQTANAQPLVRERFRRHNEGVVDAELAGARIHGFFTPLVDLIELAGVLAVIALGTVAVADGTLTIGGMLVFVAYLSQLLGPIRDLGSLANTFFRALAGAERVIELLDERPRVCDRAGAPALGRVRGAISLEGVTLAYPGAESPALYDVTLEVEPGQTLAVVGPSGAGKSSLARLLVRLYDPDGGVVRLDNRDLRDVTLKSVRENVALLLQEALVMRGTVAENIRFGRPGASDDEVRAAARAAGADAFIAGLADGYATDIGERGRRLSGGQRQRLAIARTLLADAPVLVLDEPTTGLDAVAREQLLAPLHEIAARRTAVVISHDLQTAAEADLVAVLDGGRLVQSGTHDDLLAADGLYARLWAVQQAGLRTEPARLEAVA
jgi:subfamily B ATP-binding cassette protein MsbA